MGVSVHLPRMRPLSSRKSAILSVLDVGTTKIVCLIARLDPIEAGQPSRGRTHGCRILGIGHQRSRGIKAGVVVDMEEAENAIRLAVDAAERMAGVQVEGVIVNMTGGRIGSQLYTAKIGVSGRVLDVLVGPAGTGKTTTMRALRRAWERRYGPGSVTRRSCGPRCTTRPRSMTITSSAAWAVEIRCAIVMEVRPRERESRARWRRTSVAGSTAEVASSRTRRSGSAR